MKVHPAHDVDIVIAGGGAAGLSLALGLCHSTTLSVAVIEAKPFDADQHHPGFDARSVALARYSIERLTDNGLGNAATLGSAIKHIHVSDKGRLGTCSMQAEQFGVNELGRVIELHELGQALHQALTPYVNKQLQLFCPDSIAALEQQDDGIQVALQSGLQLHAKLLVVAEGAQSPTRALLGFEVNETDYQQTAVIANVTTNQPHAGRAFERFTNTGPVALLPLTSHSHERSAGRWSLVWSVNPSDAASLLNCSEAQFAHQLQSAFGYRAGIIQHVGQRGSYPLKLIHASEHIRHRAVVIANCAQSLHPIAGQGLNLGLRDVYSLLSVLREAVSLHQDIGAYSVLHQYQRLQKRDQARTISMTDSLVRLFSNDYFPLTFARNAGLYALHQLSPLKKQFADVAMGKGTRNQLAQSIKERT
ncbi:2-octaprenyl-6-methoxyphenyl hydroxylase [Aestuariibacter sp. AA17]|uniref:2-octaprenyl-6-methoxyphenyl hydroxylase n=1 Tax=Fluctibacter corallii TaxID=2984329 RepID=A0ABT3A445_9ALTE|nr:2-octaprenyl-6-methoxyphenyl hydroxylase [Aestuariibacter sp. AA17]MCV2883454.1 2-octaprenyl-6-methoxyphenyl hydroxylase [Aestuariibacter sp. AA17]